MTPSAYTQILSNKNFIEQYKKADVRIRKAFDKQVKIFAKNPKNLGLRNHLLREKWDGYRSIDITSNWRAIYRELTEGKEHVAYFIALGTHDQLYK